MSYQWKTSEKQVLEPIWLSFAKIAFTETLRYYDDPNAKFVASRAAEFADEMTKEYRERLENGNV